MSTKTIKSRFVPGRSIKAPLNSGRSSTYLNEHDEPSGRLKNGLEKMEAAIHRFREIYCIKQPR